MDDVIETISPSCVRCQASLPVYQGPRRLIPLISPEEKFIQTISRRLFLSDAHSAPSFGISSTMSDSKLKSNPLTQSPNLGMYQAQRLAMELAQMQAKHKELESRVLFCTEGIKKILVRLNLTPDLMQESRLLMDLATPRGDEGQKSKEREKEESKKGKGDSDDASSTDEEGNEDGGDGTGSGSKKRHRGKLPDWATTALTQWLWDHSAQPYPSEEEKTTLVAQTGLTLVQINNWFSNARRRILKKKHKTQHNPSSSELIFTQEIPAAASKPAPKPAATTPTPAATPGKGPSGNGASANLSAPTTPPKSAPSATPSPAPVARSSSNAAKPPATTPSRPAPIPATPATADGRIQLPPISLISTFNATPATASKS